VHGDLGNPVGEDIVHLASDARAFLETGLGCSKVALAFRNLGPAA
jgi:hypothetical protein